MKATNPLSSNQKSLRIQHSKQISHTTTVNDVEQQFFCLIFYKQSDKNVSLLWYDLDMNLQNLVIPIGHPHPLPNAHQSIKGHLERVCVVLSCL